MLNDNEVIKMAMQNTLHALADPTRREILNLLILLSIFQFRELLFQDIYRF